MKIFLKTISAVALFLAICACGKSPILNHVNASDLRTSGFDPNASTQSMDGGVGNEVIFQNTTYRTTLQWQEGQPRSRTNTSFKLRFYLASGAQSVQLPTTPAVDLWMSSMGHGSSAVSVGVANTDNVGAYYLVTNVNFIMAGPWHVQVAERASSLEENCAGQQEDRHFCTRFSVEVAPRR